MINNDEKLFLVEQSLLNIENLRVTTKIVQSWDGIKIDLMQKFWTAFDKKFKKVIEGEFKFDDTDYTYKNMLKESPLRKWKYLLFNNSSWPEQICVTFGPESNDARDFAFGVGSFTDKKAIDTGRKELRTFLNNELKTSLKATENYPFWYWADTPYKYFSEEITLISMRECFDIKNNKWEFVEDPKFANNLISQIITIIESVDKFCSKNKLLFQKVE